MCDLVLSGRGDAFLARSEVLRGVGRMELEKSPAGLLVATEAALSWHRDWLESFRAGGASEASLDSRRSPRKGDAASPLPP